MSQNDNLLTGNTCHAIQNKINFGTLSPAMCEQYFVGKKSFYDCLHKIPLLLLQKINYQYVDYSRGL